LVLEDYGRLAVQEHARPSAGPGEVLVRIIATGICGSDIHGYAGETGRRSPGQIMGHETVGRIEELGNGVHQPGLEVGVRVTYNPLVGCGDCPPCHHWEPHYCPDKYVIGADPRRSAAFAEFVAVPAGNIVVLPQDMPAAYGALIEPLAVALHAVRRAGLQPGETLLVVGGGPIGQSAVLAARFIGAARILASEPDAARRELMARLGAETIDPATREVPTEVGRILGGPVDRALDAVGLEATLRTALEATRLGGTVCLAGLAAPRIGLDAYRLSVQERGIMGTFCYAPGDFRDAAQYVACVPNGIEHLISRSVALEDAPAIFASLAAGNVPPGKVLVYMGQPPAPERTAASHGTTPAGTQPPLPFSRARDDPVAGLQGPG
jgi:threonine dehydrogenase-like Zn-dependent dehydrogenase